MDLSGIIDSLPGVTITVTRYVAPSVGSDGFPVSKATSRAYTTKALVQVENPDKTRLDIDSERKTRRLIVHTKAELLGADTTQYADTVTYSGRDYKVMETSDWLTQARFCRSICVLVE